MNKSNNSPGSEGNPLLRLGKKAVEAFVTVVALLIYIVREPRLWLKEKVYKGFFGWCRAGLGLVIAFGASYSTGQHLGWELQYPTLAWLGIAVLVWFATFCYLWPALYHFVIKNAFDLVDFITKKLRKVLQDYAEPFFNGLVLGMARVLPGSTRAWQVMLNKERRLWTNTLVGGLAWLGAFAGTVYIGWEAFAAVSALSFWGLPAVPFIAGVAAGVVVFGLVGAALFGLINYGKIAFVGVGITAGLTYLYHAELAGLGASLGLTGAWTLVMLPLFAVLFLGYVFPYVSWALSGDLVKKIIKQLEKLNDACYGDKNEGYVKFFAHTANIISSLALAYGAWYLCGLTGLTEWSPLGLTWVGTVVSGLLVAVSAVIAYLEVYDLWFDKTSRLGFAGFFASCYAGYEVVNCYVGNDLTGGYWLGVPAGGLVALLVGFIAIPLAYLGLRYVLLLLKADKAGEPLNKAHKAVETEMKNLWKRLETVYEHSYRDRTAYQEWFLHASNIGVAVTLYFLTAALCAWLGFGVVCTYLTIGVVVGLSYILVGKFLLKSDVGTEFVGAITGLAAGIYVGTVLHAAVGSWWLTILMGVFSWTMVVFLFFPVAYLLVRFVANPLLASWLLKPLAVLHGYAWAGFKAFADQVSAAYKALKIRLQPVWTKIAEIWASVAAAYARIRDKFSKKS